jgi:hypothetical protein
MSGQQTAIVIDPGSYYAYKAIGLRHQQIACMEIAEEEKAEYPIEEAARTARFILVCEGERVPPDEVLFPVLGRIRRQRKDVWKEVLYHQQICSGCEECMPLSELDALN